MGKTGDDTFLHCSIGSPLFSHFLDYALCFRFLRKCCHVAKGALVSTKLVGLERGSLIPYVVHPMRTNDLHHR